MIYYTIEFQSGVTGATQVFAYAPGDYEKPKEEAISKFHSILSFAVKSDVPYHGALVIAGDGTLVDFKFYNHTGGGD